MKKIPLICSAMLVCTFLALGPAAFAATGQSQLGIYLQNLDDDLRRHFNYTADGVLITGVIEGTGADKAGLAEEDIIVEINKEKAASIGDIKRILENVNPGEEIELKIIRGGKPKMVRVMLTEKNPSYANPPRKWIYYPGDYRPYMGIRIQDLNPQLAQYFNVKAGILIAEVIQDSPAETAKLKAGDVVTGWNTQIITNTHDFYRQLDKSKPQEEIQLAITRQRKQKTVGITLAAPEKDDNRLFGFYLDKEDPEDLIFRFRKPRIDNFPFLNPSKPDDSHRQDHDGSRLDAIEKEMGVLKEKLDQLINKMNQ